jgi:hypothetical protein
MKCPNCQNENSVGQIIDGLEHIHCGGTCGYLRLEKDGSATALDAPPVGWKQPGQQGDTGAGGPGKDAQAASVGVVDKDKSTLSPIDTPAPVKPDIKNESAGEDDESIPINLNLEFSDD